MRIIIILISNTITITKEFFVDSMTIIELINLSTAPLQWLVLPEKRIFWGYLLSSVLLLMCACRLTKIPVWKSCRQLLSLQIWLHRSSINDFKWFFFNHFFSILIIVPLLGGSLSVALSINRVLISQFGEGNFWAGPQMMVWSLFTVVIFLAEDFSRFLLHYCYHQHRWLWRFHAIHHSAEVLTPITLYRIHWLEMIINSIRGLLVIGTVSALFMYAFDGAISTIDVVGVSIFTFFFNMAGANLRHSSIYLGFGKLERWLISPAQHQIHHSRAHHHKDKNFGACLSIWDRWFDSFLASKGETVTQYGIDEEVKTNRSTQSDAKGRNKSEAKNESKSNAQSSHKKHHSFLGGFWGI